MAMGRVEGESEEHSIISVRQQTSSSQGLTLRLRGGRGEGDDAETDGDGDALEVARRQIESVLDESQLPLSYVAFTPCFHYIWIIHRHTNNFSNTFFFSLLKIINISG